MEFRAGTLNSEEFKFATLNLQSQTLPSRGSDTTFALEKERTADSGTKIKTGNTANTKVREAKLTFQVDDFVKKEPHSTQWKCTAGQCLEEVGNQKCSSCSRDAVYPVSPVF